MNIKKGDRVKVDFISESSTEFSGNRFLGVGVVDRVEDGYVFGRLDDRRTFMCLLSDVVQYGQDVLEGLRFKHMTSGNLYRIIAMANDCDSEKFPRTIVYKSLGDGSVYSRPYLDFLKHFKLWEGK